MTLKLFNLSIFAAILTTAHAVVKPSTMFGDGMVLQREMPAPIWGSAGPGEKISVSFAGQTKSTTAGQDGKWMVKLEPLSASAEGKKLTISGSNIVEFKDVLVGEVWICSGQSNMAFGIKGQKSVAVPELWALMPDAQKKPIRVFNVQNWVALEPMENCRGSWSTEPANSAVAFGFSYYLQEQIKVPVAVILTCWGSTPIESWMPLDMTNELPHFAKIMDDFKNKNKDKVSGIMKAADAGGKGIDKGNSVFLRTQPNIVYNAMMHPVAPFAVRGMVWYQGEANAGQPDVYAKSLPAWVKRMRKHLGNDDLHFLAVMLPRYGSNRGEPSDRRSWSWMREAQMNVLNLPHTGIANTIDLGEANNIHPKDKQPVGQRLALIAARDVYKKPVIAEGPRFKAIKVDGATVTVSYDHAEGLKTSDGNVPNKFWLAGADKKWQQAKAKIEGQTIVLTANGLSSPVAVRYAFTSFPEVNLVNGAGLPAYPFRTDSW